MDVLRRFGAPVTAGIGLLAVLTFLLSFFRISLTGLVHRGDLSEPWTHLTYPFAPTASIFSLALSLLMLVWLGGSLERELGSARFAGTVAGLTLIGGLGFTLGSLLLRTPLAVAGLSIPLAALTVLWGVRHRQARIMLYGLIPMTGQWLAIIAAVFAFFAVSPEYGFFSLIPLGAAWALGVRGVPGASPAALANRPTKAEIERENALRDDEIRRRMRREEDERLRKLLGE